jgi:hypothetical protein
MGITRRITASASLLFLVATAFARADGLEPLLGDIAQAEARKAPAEGPVPDDLKKKLARIDQLSEGLRASVAQGALDQALHAARDLAAVDPSEEMQKKTAALISHLQKLSDDLAATLTAPIDQALTETGAAIVAAKTAQDLDPLPAKLAAAREILRSNALPGPTRDAYGRKLDAAVRFVNGWQEYLAYTAAGNSRQAHDALRNLSSNNGTVDFQPIPRSELLARMQEGGEDAAGDGSGGVLASVKTLDDIPGALRRAEAIQQSGGNQIYRLVNTLQAINGAYASYRAGNLGAAMQSLQNYSFNGASFDALLPLVRALDLKIIAAQLGAGDWAAPQADEAPGAYLQRLAEGRRKAAQWPELFHVLATCQQWSMAGSYDARIAEDLQALHAFLSGRQQEEAHQIADAIRSYRKALLPLGLYFPPSAAAERLAALQKAYPEIYQAISREALDKVSWNAPSAPPYFSTGWRGV